MNRVVRIEKSSTSDDKYDLYIDSREIMRNSTLSQCLNYLKGLDSPYPEDYEEEQSMSEYSNEYNGLFYCTYDVCRILNNTKGFEVHDNPNISKHNGGAIINYRGKMYTIQIKELEPTSDNK